MGMCVLSFGYNAHPDWRLVLAGNRDELHARPAAPLARWADHQEILAGKDLESGGTWLGVSERGIMAVVTNVHGGVKHAANRSRGLLVLEQLEGLGLDTVEPAAYNAFNLIVADAGGMAFLSNAGLAERRHLADGLYGLANADLDDPWPRTLQLKAGLQDWFDGGAKEPAQLLDLLAERELQQRFLPPVGDPNGAQSPVFIRNEVYGTRCSTVVAVGHDGDGMMIERRYDANGAVSGETTLPFRWP